MTAKLTLEAFIQRAKAAHGEMYNYSNAVYRGLRNHVTIVCPEHGEFSQSAEAHINQGQGCPECGKLKSAKSRLNSHEDFLRKVPEEYTARYDMSRTAYEGLYTPVSVSCKLHGEFKVKPCDIYCNVGCPECSTSGFNKKRPAYVYILKTSCGIVKIGVTNRAPEKRARRVSISSGKEFSVAYSLRVDGATAITLEKEMLKDLRQAYSSPLKVYDGSTESFVNLPVSVAISKLEKLYEYGYF